MKSKVFVFFAIVFFTLSIVPIVNLVLGVKKFKVKYLYNIDFIIPKLNGFLYDYGLNAYPGQVVIGKNNWLYLGDDYADTITLAREGIDPSYIKNAIAKKNKLDAWDGFFKSKGVKDFKILVGPNKSSVYPEFLPDWVKLSESRKINILMEATNSEYYIYPENILLSAKEIYEGHDLYHKTDTHWNNLGAWVVFDHFIKEIKIKNPEINYNQNILLKRPVEISAGDLSGFLRLTGSLKDQQQIIEFLPSFDVETECHTFYAGEKIECVGNPKIISQKEPLLVTATGSLNDKKLLWIRDSFGTAMSQYMARTFSNVIQVHYDNLDKDKLIDIVEDFKPDYVFMTIVERSIDGGLPLEYPETGLAKDNMYSYSSELIASNDLEKKDDGFYISGEDPFLIYKLEREVDGEFNDTVAISLMCDGYEKESVDIQVFWKKNENDNFSEVNSARYLISQGISYVEPSLNSNWNSEESIQYLRLDIESSSINKCMKFNIKNLVFNKSL